MAHPRYRAAVRDSKPHTWMCGCSDLSEQGPCQDRSSRPQADLHIGECSIERSGGAASSGR